MVLTPLYKNRGIIVETIIKKKKVVLQFNKI